VIDLFQSTNSQQTDLDRFIIARAEAEFLSNINQGDEMTVHIESGANKLLDHVIATLQLKNDNALSRALEVAPPVISKIRHHRLLVGDSIILRIHRKTGMPVAEIDAYLVP
jgi:hypothetical protein